MKTLYYLKLSNPFGLAIIDLVDYYDKGYIITRINVPKAHRGKGIARKLLQEVINDADEAKVDLFLEVNASDGLTRDELYKWYNRRGFKGTGLLKRKSKDKKYNYE